MGIIGRKPADAPLTSADINDGTITPDDLSTGHPTWTTGGNVGIGTASPIGKLAVHAPTSAGIELKHTGNATTWFTGVEAAQGDLPFGRGGTEIIRILNAGGITFNGDTAAANALDDYEEGTFTPTVTLSTVGSTVAYTMQYGRYTKVGDRVFLIYML